MKSESMPEEIEPTTPAAPETSSEPVVINPAFSRGYGTGRRKESVARVYLRPGSGNMWVNGRPFEKYFCGAALQSIVKQPLVVTETAGLFDIRIGVRGGGPAGQAGAARLGIARALLEYNIELRKKLKKLGLLTRDARVHERKKYGQKGARKRFQYSKR